MMRSLRPCSYVQVRLDFSDGSHHVLSALEDNSQLIAYAFPAVSTEWVKITVEAVHGSPKTQGALEIRFSDSTEGRGLCEQQGLLAVASAGDCSAACALLGLPFSYGHWSNSPRCFTAEGGTVCKWNVNNDDAEYSPDDRQVCGGEDTGPEPVILEGAQLKIVDTAQVDTHGSSVSYRAADEQQLSSSNTETSTHTKNGADRWWRADFGAVRRLARVHIVNRQVPPARV